MRSLKGNKFTEYMWKKQFDYDNDFKNQTASHWNSNMRDQLCDLFGAYYKHETNYTDNPDILFKSFFDAVKDTKEFKESIEKTKNNPILSYFATKKMSEEMDAMMEKTFKELQQKQKELQNAPDKVKQDAMKDALEKSKDMIRAHMRKAAKETTKATEEAETLIKVAGIGNEQGQPTKIEDMKEIMDLSKKVLTNPFFLKIVEMAGRMQQRAHTTLMTKAKGMGVPVGVELGNDITKLIPSEYAMMSDPDLELLFWKNYVDEALFQFEEEGDEPQSLGPVIVCEDQSGSMYGSKHSYSSAILFGIWTICQKQKRALYVVPFDTKAMTVKITCQKDILDYMQSFMSGGTDFNMPLIEAINIMKQYPEMEKADMIFITDGASCTSKAIIDEFNAFKTSVSFKVLGVSIGWDYPADEMKLFCDKVFKVNSLEGKDSDAFIEEAFNI